MCGESRFIDAFLTVAALRKVLERLLCLTAFLFVASTTGTAGTTIPVPRERLEFATGDRPPGTKLTPSPCQLRLTKIAVFEPLPPIRGPGECVATDVVKVDAILLADKQHVALSPSVTLRCPMAETVVQWITNDAAPAIVVLGTPLSSIETVDSFDCRPRNGIAGAQISEHGRANALDLHSFKLANGMALELNNASAPKSIREKLRDGACARFSTVLGNGADAYHDTHVHLDLMKRSNHYKICQWDVLDSTEVAARAERKIAAITARVPAGIPEASDIPLPYSRPVASTDAVIPPQYRAARPLAPSFAAALGTFSSTHADEQTVTVGPWTVGTSYKGDKFDSCSMRRSTAELDISFLRAQDGLQLVLDSQKWKLERGKAYVVQLVAGSRPVEAKAQAELKAVTIALADKALNERLRTADVLEVRGEGATLRVPLDGSAAAFGRLEACFDKNSRGDVESNPFVAPSRKP